MGINKHRAQKWIAFSIFLIGVIVALLGLGNRNEATSIVGGIIALAGLVWFFIALNNSRRICDYCGGSMDGCAYSYQETYRRGRLFVGGMKSKVHFECVCPTCEKEKRFNHVFRVRVGGNVKHRIDTYCKGRFGH